MRGYVPRDPCGDDDGVHYHIRDEVRLISEGFPCRKCGSVQLHPTLGIEVFHMLFEKRNTKKEDIYQTAYTIIQFTN